MEKALETIQFINDLYVFANNLKKREYGLDNIIFSHRFKFYHPGAILASILMDKEFNNCNSINKDAFYIFFNLATQNFIYFDGAEMPQIQYVNLNDTLLGLANVKETLTHILHPDYVTKKMASIKNIMKKINSSNLSDILKIADSYYSTFKNIVKTKQSTNLLLLNTTYEIEDEIDAEYFTDSHMYTILSTCIDLEYSYYDCCEDGYFLKENTVKKFIQYIMKKFYSYKQLRDFMFLRVYPEFIANADGRQCYGFITIEFDINDPLKLLLLIESIEVADTI